METKYLDIHITYSDKDKGWQLSKIDGRHTKKSEIIV